MHIYTLECEMVTECSLQDTFAVFEDPYNLAKITPPWLSFQVVSRDRIQMRKGAEIDYRIKYLGLPMRWRSLIREYEPPFFFVDEQIKGPYLFWRHQHIFTPTSQGTRVADRVEYGLPFGVLGRVANAVMVGRQLREIFEYRQRELGKIFGGNAVTTIEPSVR